MIEATRKFVDRLDEALPDLGEERRVLLLGVAAQAGALAAMREIYNAEDIDKAQLAGRG